MAAVGEPGGPIGGPALEARIAVPPPAVDDVPLAHPSAGRARTGHPARPVQADPALDAQRDVLRADRAGPARTRDGGEEGEVAHRFGSSRNIDRAPRSIDASPFPNPLATSASYFGMASIPSGVIHQNWGRP